MNTEETAKVVFKEAVLEGLKVYATEHTASYVVRHAEFIQRIDLVSDHLVHTLYSHVLAERCDPETFEVEFYSDASWWQHTKRVHFPTISTWIRRPPRTKTTARTVEVSRYVTYPAATLQLPKDQWGEPVRVIIPQSIYEQTDAR